ncbi:sugar O-acetyltransferase [Duncaniella freteri]|uniref:sugar O-acetyltransferase n=1 Tax=Duncaniella freteri TaxID=2530391 RepID=UPI00257283D2|nr:sugar O-acetyltransferase [Duncaniella freteri]
MDSLELMASGAWHNGFATEIGNALGRASRLCFSLNAISPENKSERESIIRELFGEIGGRFIINSPFRCDIGYNIHVGDNLICNFNVTILDEAEVRIGDNVFIGPNTSICTITHALDFRQRNEGIMRSAPVTIGSNVWIGAGVTVLPGVTIGDGSVIGAGSLVTKDIPSGVLALGSPCRVVREITEADVVTDILCPD